MTAAVLGVYPMWRIVLNVLDAVLHWLFFSVVLSLLHLGLAILVFWLADKPIAWLDLLKTGTLLFFATTLTSKSFGDFYRANLQVPRLLRTFAIIILLAIIVPAAFVYAVIVSAPVIGQAVLPPNKVAAISLRVCLGATIYGLSLWLVTQTLQGKLSDTSTSPGTTR